MPARITANASGILITFLQFGILILLKRCPDNLPSPWLAIRQGPVSRNHTPEDITFGGVAAHNGKTLND
jgi:hypothetical protein